MAQLLTHPPMFAGRRSPSAPPKSPVFGWGSLRGGSSDLPSVDHHPRAVMTTSGRAALWLALQQLRLPAGSRVLVPTYHCPTMVAPVLLAGLTPLFYAIDDEGQPDLRRLDTDGGTSAKAIIVAHFFGLPRSLAAIRSWCDRHGLSLIEDCAHCLFGHAGERPVGAWGDYATASLSKFLPVPEAGILLPNGPSRLDLALEPRTPREQLKGLVDVLELGVRHGLLPGLDLVLRPMLELKSRRHASAHPRSSVELSADLPPATAEEMFDACDMGRTGLAPLWVSRWLARHLPRGGVTRRRRRNFEFLASRLSGVPGLRPLFLAHPEPAAPYVFPLWVDDADAVYAQLRRLGAPVFRWDRIWPGTPCLQGDHGPDWSRHVLQLLCHQDLGEPQLGSLTDTLTRLVSRRGAPP